MAPDNNKSHRKPDEHQALPSQHEDRSQVPSRSIAAAVVVIAGIYFARDILVPISLAFLLAFLLGPLVSRLRRIGLPRSLAVIAAVAVGASIFAGVATMVGVQLVELATRLPQYQENIQNKLRSVSSSGDGPIERFVQLLSRLDKQMKTEQDEAKKEAADREKAEGEQAPPGAEPEEAQAKPVQVEIVTPQVTPMDMLGAVAGSALSLLVSGGIVLVLLIFMLLEREEIRNRVVRLLGHRTGQLYVTTQTIDDAAHRVSQYLRAQLIVSVCFGVPIGIGLFFIGVPNAALWGLLAIALRFIPLLGPWLSAIMPLTLAIAVDPGWSTAIWTIALFVGMELIINNVIEPVLYGQSIGISRVGVILSVIFWSWLWGPVGLLMAMPLTACLMVLGRHIPALRVLPVLLGDQPVLPLHARLYQRLLAMDTDEPEELVRDYLADHDLESLYSDVLVPLLRLMEDERLHHTLEPAHHAFILDFMRELIDDTALIVANAEKSKSEESAMPDEAPPASDESRPVKVVCTPAHDVSDELVGLMLAKLLERRGVNAVSLSADLLASERLDRLAELAPTWTCVSVLPPFASVHGRQAAKRIHERLPDAKLLIGFWETDIEGANLEQRLLTVGHPEVVTTLAAALDKLSN